MKATVRRYFRAAGSILDIAPATDYTKIRKRTSDYQSLKGDFRCIGGDFNRAIVAINAQKTKTAI